MRFTPLPGSWQLTKEHPDGKEKKKDNNKAQAQKIWV